MTSPDIVIIGTGAGGGTIARALAPSGARILILERGDRLPFESGEGTDLQFERWEDGQGEPFRPRVHEGVGGSTRGYGAVLQRLRVEDFAALEHEGGTSPGWPIGYAEFEPYYRVAESWYRVHGEAGIDPGEPWRSAPYPCPALPCQSEQGDIADGFRTLGLAPYPLPRGIVPRSGDRCAQWTAVDSYAQGFDVADAHACGIVPALESKNVELWTGATAIRLLSGDRKRIVAIDVERHGVRETVRAGIVVVAAGTLNSAALLLRSGNRPGDAGLANSSGMVGRCVMMHNIAALRALRPRETGGSGVDGYLGVNDFYLRGPGFPWPMGHMQTASREQNATILRESRRFPARLVDRTTSWGTDWWVVGEDLPRPDNRVTVEPSGAVRVNWNAANTVAHDRFVKTAKEMFRELGFRLTIAKKMTLATNIHHLGSMRFGDDPAISVLDRWCRTHDFDNLYVVDGSFFPSAGAVDPALTIIAQAIRVGEHIGGIRHTGQFAQTSPGRVA